MSKKLAVSLMGSVLAGIAASLCCVAPLLFLFLGVGGAWVSNLVALEPYRPLFIVVAIVALVIAYSQLYLPIANPSCEESKVCAEPSIKRLYKNLFLLVVVVVLASIVSPHLISSLLSE